MSEGLKEALRAQATKARAAAYQLAQLSANERNQLILAMREALANARTAVLDANKQDCENAAAMKLAPALVDRLTLSDARFDAMLQNLQDVAKQEDPLGVVLETRTLANGLELSKVSVPIGVIGMIYEARPNVSADAAVLCIRSGNAVILKGGSEALLSNRAICDAITAPLRAAGLEGAITFIDSKDREAVRALVQLEGLVDLVIPRGGEGLIHSVMEWARVPVIKHAKGVCHTFVDDSADLEMALAICENAKCQRPGVCNAMESLLVHEAVANQFLPKVVTLLTHQGVEVRGDARARALSPTIAPASEDDWSTEYLDLILSVKIVSSFEEAVAHINRYGSHHSDAIVSETTAHQKRFLDEVDSAVVYVNASTRFTDGAQFGMGAEIGISTDRLHARGPMGAKELTTYKWKAIGSGQIRA